MVAFFIKKDKRNKINTFHLYKVLSDCSNSFNQTIYNEFVFLDQKYTNKY